VPWAFSSLSRQEQEWRGRYFLMVWCLYQSEPYAWAIALASDTWEDNGARRTTATVADEAIISAVEGFGSGTN
jgi:hypothetical protein